MWLRKNAETNKTAVLVKQILINIEYFFSKNKNNCLERGCSLFIFYCTFLKYFIYKSLHLLEKMSIDYGNLCSVILKQCFGETVQIVGDCLFGANARTLSNLVKTSNLTRREVSLSKKI